MNAPTYTITEWLRVNRSLPCPVCSHTDWCLVAADKSAVICPRVESPKRAGDAGYLHRLIDAPRPSGPPRVVIRPRPTPPDLTFLARAYQEAADPDRLAALAAELGVTVPSLQVFGVGWAADRNCWSFPMTDPVTSKVTGIRLRKPDGSKFSVTGGKESLFLPGTMTADEVLLVTEGATDAAAGYSIGLLNSVGRPSCTGGVTHLVALVRSRKPIAVVIVQDADEPGVRGAEALARALALYCRDVRVIAPPADHKDLRAWVSAGATRAEVEQLIQAADRRRVNIKITSPGRGEK